MSDCKLVRLLEIIRDSDVARGGTDTTKPPLKNAIWVADEKKWLYPTSELSMLVIDLSRIDHPFHVIYQREGEYLVVIHDSDCVS